MSKASSLSGNMARAARLAPAASSEASSTVKSRSWLMTDMTILIMICSRRMFLVSCSFSVRCAENSARSQVLIRPPKCLKTRGAPSFSMPAATRRCAHAVGLFCRHSAANATSRECRTSVTRATRGTIRGFQAGLVRCSRLLSRTEDL